MASRPTLLLEQQHEGLVCGIDEAGRGPWAGPVVAATVVWPHNLTPPETLNDSKKLTRAQREAIYHFLLDHTQFSVGVASVTEIDELNILAATKLAMQRAVTALPVMPAVALVDGNQPPALPCQCQPVIRGDSLSVSIAAASIIAKVTRDRIMEAMSQHYPDYGFERHVGYGTKQHQAALERYGVTPEHRRSFSPIRQLLERLQSL